MTAWSVLRDGIDAFTRKLPLLLGIWLAILACQQLIDVLVPDTWFWIETIASLLLLAPLYAGQQLVALKVVRGEPCSLRTLLDGVRRWRTILCAYALTWSLTALGLAAFIVPGVFAALVYSFVPILILDSEGEGSNVSAMEAMRTSVRITRGYRGLIFGIGLLLLAPSLVLMILFWTAAVPDWIIEIAALLSGTLFLGPVQATTLMTVYERARGNPPSGVSI
jgi:uncharacterized membrane protein